MWTSPACPYSSSTAGHAPVSQALLCGRGSEKEMSSQFKGQDYQAKNTVNYFLGVYSGRLRGDSDLGLVWKRSCIEELLNHATAHGTQHEMERRRHRFSASFSDDFSLNRFIGDDFEEV